MKKLSSMAKMEIFIVVCGILVLGIFVHGVIKESAKLPTAIEHKTR